MVWQLNNHIARLSFGNLACSIDLDRPESGLCQVSLAGVGLPGAELLALRIDADSAPQVQLTDCFARGVGLYASYRAAQGAECATGATALSLQTVWRPLFGTGPHTSEATGEIGVELAVLANCEAPECHPRLDVRSRLAECETAASIDPPGPGALLLRLPGGKWSYTQMIHPVDDQGVRVTARGQHGLEVIHLLFGEVMEKGVIWLARMRGFFMPRDGDEETLARLYAQFAAAPPPLGD